MGPNGQRVLHQLWKCYPYLRDHQYRYRLYHVGTPGTIGLGLKSFNGTEMALDCNFHGWWNVSLDVVTQAAEARPRPKEGSGVNQWRPSTDSLVRTCIVSMVRLTYTEVFGSTPDPSCKYRLGYL